jgi:hypothetical protein
MENDTERTSPDPLPGTEPEADDPMVAVFSSSNHDGEMEAMAVKGVLDSNGIPAILVGPQVLPTLEFQVQVPEHLLIEAQQVIEQAQLAGPRAAEEAEAQTE